MPGTGEVLAFDGGILIGFGFSTGIGIAVAAVAAAVLGILDLFGIDLFGGGHAPPLSAGHFRVPHYVPSEFIGCSDVTPNMENSMGEEIAGPYLPESR
jgi:hypothetical protein